MFFNLKSQVKTALITSNELMEIAKIKPNLTKLDSVIINCRNMSPLSLNGNLICHNNKKNIFRLLGGFFNTESLLKGLTTCAEILFEMNLKNLETNK
jgi:hypothetical protein